ncbi:MAG: 1-(5-phosphoribosyl)-5-[(5-phosphoribosylamino)methylideneamino]imidazole-4-carboxamide isomerase [Phycisphaerae bacterium]|nr:1-(5-phosphoribosyl)-5-[(5-phosphoribosylamino)methylideneamino]imidazole-4-carboxamide isomerase [Phycisphaerae bacterium]
MIILPAIDLRDGKCVRLIQGQYDHQITYKDNPAAQAVDFQTDGATWLHVVDLDGAKEGRPVNTQSIEAIVRQTSLHVEVGGGLRDENAIKTLLDIGVKRVIIGTRAVSDYDWFSEMARAFPGQIVLGLDARGSHVSTHGWQEDSALTILDFARQAAELPLAAIIYTDIAKDGMLCGPNIERTQAVAEAVNIPVIASGGVSKIDDIRDLLRVPSIHGVIAGRSLYEGTLNLKEAIALTQTS